MSVAIATPEPITVAVRPAEGPNETRMCQAQWTRELETGWKHRAHMPGDKPGTPPTLATHHGQLEERSGVQIGKPGYDQEGRKHEPCFVAHRLWMKSHHLLVDWLLERSELVVATLPDMPTEPVGWAVFEGPTLHFAFVVPAARRCTIGTQLVLASQCSAASHMTPAGRGLVRHLRAKK